MNKIASDAQAAASKHAASNLPLAGIRVIDLTRIYSGPYCTFLMAMAGAEVIKIEPPEGETLRKRNGRSGASLPFAMLNANKRLLTLNLKSKKGAEILAQLLKTADVLVENFRPGVMDRLGFSMAKLKEINPRLIVAQTSGYGNNGPYRDYPAMDLTVQAVSGIMDSTGYPDGPPVKAGPALVDFAAGTHLYSSIVTALFARERTGQVLTTEVAMIEAIYPTLASNLALAVATPDDYIARTGNRHGGMSLTPYNVYKAADGFVAIICNNERHWVALGKALKREDWATDPKYNPLVERVNRMDQLDDEINAETVKYTRMELFELLNKTGAACAPVRTLHEVLADPHLRERGMLHDIDHPEYGKLVVMNSPIHYGGVKQPEYRPSGEMGADIDAIFGDELKLTKAEIEDLRKAGDI
ncbi:CoA transferase [Bradyrhizobium sp. LHD-71]|uniref:CaiB/BaiF CoA transferase family protein n=1 Tax=Bradyrhizobium sp. LHD-71 TaxID=3072141 RepID=UPI00280C6C86|nr:CoA transferase [Bradyrhizobium sp. LHD-71]MDQ8726213.1 CoA transferase [Bradyrhizobium sp. LHD-71]